MTRLRLASALLALVLGACATQAPPPAFEVAVTVDDLPVHGRLPSGVTRLAVTEAHLQAFRTYGVGQAWGFVNARGVETDAEGAAVLSAWRAAGHPLGNHAYSHLNLGRAPTLQDWQNDVIAGEPAVAQAMQDQDWRWFRYPNLSAGEGERAIAARQFLAERGYRIADVSLGFSDWAYTDPYVRCKAVGDEAAIAAMTAHYLREVDAGIARTLAESQTVFGRPIRHVLLTHLGAFSAATLPEVLKRLQAAGARFVSLERAQSDPAYARPGGGSLIAREAQARGIALTPDPTPTLNLQTLCR